MKILLDECLPKRLKADFPEHQTFTVPEMGWAGIKNGKLLELLESNGFAIFVTADRNLSFQQNIGKLKIAVIVIHAKSNRYSDLQPYIAKIAEALAKKPSPGVIHV